MKLVVDEMRGTPGKSFQIPRDIRCNLGRKPTDDTSLSEWVRSVYVCLHTVYAM